MDGGWGSVVIEQICPGDLIWSILADDPDGEMTPSRVLRTKVSLTTGLIDVALSVDGREWMATCMRPQIIPCGWREMVGVESVR